MSTLTHVLRGAGAPSRKPGFFHDRVGSCAILRLQGLLRASQPAALARAIREDSLRHNVRSLVVSAVDVTGSDVRALHAAPERAAEHFEALADAVVQVGAGALPVVATVDGAAAGPALGLLAHAACGVVTERTRLALPGPTFGYVPESFASFQLARELPDGVGAYLALTGAALTGAELVTLGLATHITESQALPRVEAELAQWMSARRGAGAATARRLVDETCVAPPAAAAELDDSHALHFAAEIGECFGQPSLAAVAAALEGGGGAWHAQALERLKASSPLALHLSFELLRRAAASDDWREVATLEASVAAAALRSADFGAGLNELRAAKRALLADAPDADDGAAAADGGDDAPPSPQWEAASLDAVDEAAIASYLP